MASSRARASRLPSSDSSNSTQVDGCAPSDPAPELVQLREAEALGVLDQHHGRVRNVDADLDHRRRDQQVRASRAEPVHHALLLGRAQLAVQHLDGQIGEDVGRQALRLPLRRADLVPVRLVDRRADHERLPPRLDLGPDELVGGLPLRLRPRDHGSGRLAALRHLVEDHDVQIAVVGERERPRDRGRRHDQDVRRRALALERHPLVHAEPMLFVDDGQREVRERNLLHEGMRPDDEVDVSRRDPLEDPGSVLPVTAAVSKAYVTRGSTSSSGPGSSNEA